MIKSPIFHAHKASCRLSRMRSGLAWVALLLLSACSVTQRQGAVVVYDFGPGAAPDAVLPEPAPRQWSRLGLVVKMPAGEDNDDIEYRLAYADPRVVHRYAQARWVQPPAQLLALHLQQRLGLAEAPPPRSGRCVLTVRIDQFAQVFARADASHARIAGRAVLHDPHRSTLGETAFLLESADAGQNSASGVAALVHLAGRHADDLDVWLQRLAQAGKLKNCEESLQ